MSFLHKAVGFFKCVVFNDHKACVSMRLGLVDHILSDSCIKGSKVAVDSLAKGLV